MIIIPIKWLFHWEYTLFSDKPTYFCWDLQHCAARWRAQIWNGCRRATSERYRDPRRTPGFRWLGWTLNDWPFHMDTLGRGPNCGICKHMTTSSWATNLARSQWIGAGESLPEPPQDPFEGLQLARGWVNVLVPGDIRSNKEDKCNAWSVRILTFSLLLFDIAISRRQFWCSGYHTGSRWSNSDFISTLDESLLYIIVIYWSNEVSHYHFFYHHLEYNIVITIQNILSY